MKFLCVNYAHMCVNRNPEVSDVAPEPLIFTLPVAFLLRKTREGHGHEEVLRC
jgi:hypothetical protein